MIPLIQLGVVTVLDTTLVYAMPTRQTILFAGTTTASFEVSIVPSTDFFPVTTQEGTLITAAPFIRCTNEEVSVICKAY